MQSIIVTKGKGSLPFHTVQNLQTPRELEDFGPEKLRFFKIDSATIRQQITDGRILQRKTVGS